MDKFTEIDGVRMHYRAEGPEDGPALVVMHGWGCNADIMRSITATAAATHRTYTIDFPGFGQSTEPPEVWGVEQYTRYIEKFIDGLGHERVSLLGHSFGGRVGILYSSRHDNVDKLILVDAAGIKPRRSLKYYMKVYGFKTGKFLANTFLPADRAAKLTDKWRGKSGSSDYNNATPRMRAILSRCVNEDLKAVMPRIKASTLMIWGENDTATPLSDAKYMEKHIAGSGLVSFPGCGHFSFLDNPVQFAAVLRSFLRS